MGQLRMGRRVARDRLPMIKPDSVEPDKLLPPTAKRRVYERIALKIREFAGVPLDQPLDPWQLTGHVKLRVVNINQVVGLSQEARVALLGDSSKNWSGATTMPLPDG